MIAGAESSAIDAFRAGQAEEQCLFYVGLSTPATAIPLCADREEQRPQQAAFAIP
jgi:hypothetical protein